jgi:2-haloacid dehalogenase
MTDAALDYAAFEALTFDCYGTLIDWETGLLDAFRPILAAHRVAIAEDDLLGRFARHEAALEAGPYLVYRVVLAGALRGILAEFGSEPTAAETAAFSGSVADWPPFADSPAALARLKERFGLGVITNCDDDLFAASNRRLGVEFDWIVTAQRVRAYKPDEAGFRLAFEQIGIPRQRILHVAQSVFHDHVPARRLGLSSVWIDRRGGKRGSGATPAAVGAAPAATFPTLQAFAEAAAPEAPGGHDER